MANTSSSTPNGSPYIYLPLDSNLKEIRLIVLKEGSGADRIECSIKHVSLNSHPHYNALSYAWGTSEEDQIIYVEGHAFCVNSNLFAALQQLRLPKEPRFLWIDRICISQDDILERGSQVCQMRAIFEIAALVVVWLGIESLRSAASIECMKNLAHSISRRGLNLENVSRRIKPEDLNALLAIFEEQGLLEFDVTSHWLAGIIEFFDRPWWSRVWVRQEFAVAGSIEVMCGSETIEWETIELCIQALQSLINSHIIDQRNRHSIRSCDLIWRRAYCIDLRSHTQSGTGSCLFSLVWRHARSPIAEATDHRDRIYALLGVSQDKLGLEPDYSISADVLYSRFVKAVISGLKTNSRRLGILSAHHNVANPRFPGLPSWAPDLAEPFKVAMATITVEQPRRYSATGRHTLPPLEQDFHRDDKILPLAGFCLGVVDVIGPLGTTPRTYHRDTSKAAADIRIFNACQKLALAVERLFPGKSKDAADGGEPVNDNLEEDVSRFLVLDVGLDKVTRGGKDRAGATMLPPYRNMLERENPPNDFMPHDSLEMRRMEFSKRYTQKMRDRMNKRQVFISSSGNLGAGPKNLRKNDLLCVLLGSEVPWVLRSEGDNFLLIGEAYIQGYMDGEALTAGFERQVFNLI
ncbi:hypothetical protein VTL71DRAFT_12325 [Oculimacula yallundae]|uniref:Heterokaryon incompatibility domain-containing protein n=1 Tax=Oculimacula yallundae TaxID=86028 RepID=A0ABR4CMA6_9HELO